MQTVNEYTIQLQTYHSEIVGRLIFINTKGETEESSLYSLPELGNILALWKMGALMGSFAYDSTLSETASFVMVQK